MSPILIGGATIGSFLDSTFASFDLSVFEFFGGIQSDTLTLVAKLFTSFGMAVYVVMFGIMGLVMCFFPKTRRLGLSVVFAIIIGTLLTNLLVKPMCVRIRPYNTLQGNADYWKWYVGAGKLCEHDYCFPSGHTAAATEIGVVLFINHLHSKRKPAKLISWIFPLICLGVAASRVYLMVHYATDVIGGLIFGTIAGLAGYGISCAICKFIRNRYHTRSQLPSSEKIPTAPVIAVILAWMVMFTLSFMTVKSSGGESVVRCAYDNGYYCQNDAEVDSDKYPAIDGKYYCKIHWKEIMGD